jgi:histidine triad (HIT) family protein
MSKRRDCVFCKIVRDEATSYRICENELSLSILDINPFSEGHCLVIPKRHVAWWHDLTEEESQSLFALARTTARMIKKAYRPDFVAMYVRGRRIPHTHLFLVPTFNGDPLDRFFNALEGFQEAPDRLSKLGKHNVLRGTAKKLKTRA